MRKYIFLTLEWFTQEPNGNEINNVQVIWIAQGINASEAFENLKIQNDFLLYTSFNDIYCHDLYNDNVEYFSLKW